MNQKTTDKKKSSRKPIKQQSFASSPCYTWTNKTPTESGWYWWRQNRINNDIHALKIESLTGSLYVEHQSSNFISRSYIDGFKKCFPNQQWQKIQMPNK
jgi:hypothetical protein